jgi:hypothetical protein
LEVSLAFEPCAHHWTCGAEHEWGDIDSRKGLPEGFGWDRRDFTIVNSNGIAVDPKHISYPFGGEINSRPTSTVNEQLVDFYALLKRFPEATVNHRSNLHVHWRVPGLKEDLQALKKVQRYIHRAMPVLLPMIEPIPKPTRACYSSEEEFQGAMRRYKRRKVSHHRLLTNRFLEAQLAATTVKDFFEAEVPRLKNGKPGWAISPRLCVNLRQLNETDTVEFRHFPGTLDPHEFELCLNWCQWFLVAALGTEPEPGELYHRFAQAQRNIPRFPKFPAYDHALEKRYRLTCHDGTLKRQEIEINIRKILNGEL